MVTENERVEVIRLLHLIPSENRLDFLEFLAHNLTISVRRAFEVSHEQNPEASRSTVYWLNEGQHNLVQLIHGVRTGKEPWNDENIAWWLNYWMSYKHAGDDVLWAINFTFAKLGLTDLP